MIMLVGIASVCILGGLPFAVRHRRRAWDRALRRELMDPTGRQRCWVRLLFCESDDLTIVLDGVVERCDDVSVPTGLPFSLELAAPPVAGGWVVAQLERFAEQASSVLVDVHDSVTGPKLRLLSGPLTLVFRLERRSGLPMFRSSPPPRPGGPQW